jgi:sortase A
LPSAKLFSELDKLKEGDLFMLRVLDELFTYQVDRILIVEPNQVDALLVEEGKTLCTLVTCTPYGVNTHRMLVRGHRVENPKQALQVRITADAIQVDPLVVAPIVAVPLLLVVLPVLLGGRKKK